MKPLPPLTQLAADLNAGRTTADALAETCLANIADPDGEGARAFIKTDPNATLAAARAADAARSSAGAGFQPTPLSGIPISVKDLFDIKGEVTRAGSIILSDAPPATADAPAIARLRAAGMIIVGRTNMTEFAYGGHGTNAHYGTPLNPWDRASKRIPGGSTSGGAVSVTDGMAAATIGSDTGGSVRIPAALCGLAGFKPTQARVPLTGAFPLSTTRDSIGPLGRTAACCILLDRAMAGEPIDIPDAALLKGLRFGVPTTILLDGLTPQVAAAFERSLTAISNAGGVIEEFAFPVLQEEADGSKLANFSAVEAYALHRERLATQFAKFDPRVSARLMLGAEMRAADYVDLIQLRQRLIVSANLATARFDALLAPTLAIVAPTFTELNASDEIFYRFNALLLRNCAPFNVLNRPCWSLPCHRSGEAPVGLMVIGETNGDRRLQEIGLGVEAAIAVIR